MKRDMDIIREVILAVETDRDVRGLPDRPEEVFRYHAAEAVKMGLVEGQISGEIGVRYPQVVMFDLTPAGHDLLDKIRDVTIWHETKRKVAKSGLDWTLEVIKTVAVEVIKAQFPS